MSGGAPYMGRDTRPQRRITRMQRSWSSMTTLACRRTSSTPLTRSRRSDSSPPSRRHRFLITRWWKEAASRTPPSAGSSTPALAKLVRRERRSARDPQARILARRVHREAAKAYSASGTAARIGSSRKNRTISIVASRSIRRRQSTDIEPMWQVRTQLSTSANGPV